MVLTVIPNKYSTFLHTQLICQVEHHVNLAKMRYYFSIDDDNKTCNVELWRNDFYPESRDCIIPVHNILCRFVPVNINFESSN